ncbi:acyl-CoA dehydrogenase family protein, partial [Escherichia coli]|uniref:acyl-CoA dehydrogenase family protein n=1 Tax=Escherichia coli TaxID=562 RepID=UPI00195300A4
GPGWTPAQRYIFETECGKAGTPSLLPFGVHMVGPVIIKFGTEQQKAFYLPRIVSGEDYWCQGYSEPGSGSDLASLKTKAVRDGDHYVG